MHSEAVIYVAEARQGVVPSSILDQGCASGTPIVIPEAELPSWKTHLGEGYTFHGPYLLASDLDDRALEIAEAEVQAARNWYAVLVPVTPLGRVKKYEDYLRGFDAALAVLVKIRKYTKGS